MHFDKRVGSVIPCERHDGRYPSTSHPPGTHKDADTCKDQPHPDPLHDPEFVCEGHCFHGRAARPRLKRLNLLKPQEGTADEARTHEKDDEADPIQNTPNARYRAHRKRPGSLKMARTNVPCLSHAFKSTLGRTALLLHRVVKDVMGPT